MKDHFLPVALIILALTCLRIVGVDWILDTSRYPARWNCGNWTSWLGWLHILSDVVIWLSYLAIPSMLVFFTRRRSVPFHWLFWLFSAFIVFCGTSHLMEAIIFWWPAYGLAGILKFGTALVSVATAIALWRAIPNALALNSPEQLEAKIAQRTKELEDARLQAMAIVNASPIGQIVVNDRGIIVIANPAVEEIFGYSPDELSGASIEMLVPETARRSHPKNRRNFSRQPSTRRMGEGKDLHGLHKSGENVPVEIGLTPIEIDSGRATLCSIVDLTERKQAEDAQRDYTRAITASESKLRGVIDNSNNFTCVLDTNGTVMEANRTALTAAGVDAVDVIQKPYWLTPFWSHSEKHQSRLRQAIQSAASGVRDSFEATHIAPDDSAIEIDVTLTPVANETGTVAFIIKEGRDITEHKRREAELRRLNDELSKSNRELEQFAYVASHDLQEPLRKISSYVQLLREDAEDLNAAALKDIEIVIDGAERLKILVNDLLTFSRVTTRAKSLQQVDTNECLQSAIANLELVIQENEAVITCDTFPTVIADAGQLTRLFQNLISNAIKYRGKAAPVVHVGNRMVGSTVECFVKDNGIGIEPRYFEKVFEIFQRLHKRSEYSGTGIGLAICKRMVERFGGRIWIDSTDGIGSTFYFTLNTKQAGVQP